MIVNHKVELYDAERKLLAERISGKVSARLATRLEVREFLDGAMACILSGSPPMEPSLVTDARSIHEPSPSFCNLTSGEMVEVDRLRLQGETESHIVGWLMVGRGMGAPRPRIPAAS